MSIDPGIFKRYDIRGKVGSAITEEAAVQIGQAFGTLLRRRRIHEVVIGHDNRTHSRALADSAIIGLIRAGCTVTDIGMVATPVVYWYAVEAGDIGAVQVTGSHLAPDQNGFKLAIGMRNLYGDQIADLYTMITHHDLAVGEGQAVTDEAANEGYLAMVEARLAPHARPLTIVVDGGNGMGGLYGPPLLEALGHRVIPLYCQPDGTYPNHQPDPQKESNLRDLVAAVRREGADLGLAYDGDADRVGVVDDQGAVLGADFMMVLLARDMLSRNPGAIVVGDVLCTQVLFDEVAKAGGQPLVWISGHSMIKAKMAEVGAKLGGEMSGHIFMGENYYGFDDGIFVGGRFAGLGAARQQPLSALMRTVPRLFATPEYRPHCPDDRKAGVIAAVQHALEGRYPINTVDGIRVTFERGWGLLRQSNTEPVLSLRFEGETEADALAYKQIMVEALRRAYPEVESF